MLLGDEMNERKYFDNSEYYKEKSKLSEPDGKHCIICGKDLPKFKRKYCSMKCFDDWFAKIPIARSQGEIRSKVLKRDYYTCKKCGKYKWRPVDD